MEPLVLDRPRMTRVLADFLGGMQFCALGGLDAVLAP